MNALTHLQSLPFELDQGLGTHAKIGLIILQTDQTIEHEFATILRRDDVALYHARIPNEMEVTPETLKRMEADMPIAAALLPAQFDFNVIGYCCTSGATMIGESRVDQILRKVHPKASTSNPLTACKAALRALDLKRIALVTPYAPSVTSQMRENLKASGIEVNAVASFNQSDDFTVARISSSSILAATEQIGVREDCDGVFVSCTSLRTLPIIAAAEAHLGKPVISSNQALGWHLMRLAGIDSVSENYGQLFHHPMIKGN
ncbi:Asp/Glu racemase [Celeribacter halophilus]|uniref:maleate cis-trans isomerase family protein n=1 Tax=Celeribacter halophilus TaxID=576117 RepID=UPI003A93252D